MLDNTPDPIRYLVCRAPPGPTTKRTPAREATMLYILCLVALILLIVYLVRRI